MWVFRYSDKPDWELGIRDQQTGGRLMEYPLDEDGHLRGWQSGEYAYDPRQRPWFRLGAAAATDG